MKNKPDYPLGHLVFILIFVLALSVLIGGCTPKIQTVTKTEYITCSIPATYFQTYDLPNRDWDWTDKKESDVIDFIVDHRILINSQNNKIKNIEKINQNCNNQLKNINK